jgi:hypothetical protein
MRKQRKRGRGTKTGERRHGSGGRERLQANGGKGKEAGEGRQGTGDEGRAEEVRQAKSGREEAGERSRGK